MRCKSLKHHQKYGFLQCEGEQGHDDEHFEHTLSGWHWEADAPPAPRMTPLCMEVNYINRDPLKGSHPCTRSKGHPGRHDCEDNCCWWTITTPALQPQPCAPQCEHSLRAGRYATEAETAEFFLKEARHRIAELEEERKGIRLTYNLRDPAPHERAALSRAYTCLAHVASTSADLLSVETQRELLACVAACGKALGADK